MTLKPQWIALALSLALAGCGGSSGTADPTALVPAREKVVTGDYAATAASGKINGADWTIGHARAFLSGETGQRTIALTLSDGTAADACNPKPEEEKRYVEVSGLADSGETALSEEAGNLAALVWADPASETGYQAVDGTGKVRIDSVTDTEVTGELLVGDGGDQLVNGKFTATICK